MNLTPEATLLELCIWLVTRLPAGMKKKKTKSLRFSVNMTGASAGGIPDVSPDVSRPHQSIGASLVQVAFHV